MKPTDSIDRRQMLAAGAAAAAITLVPRHVLGGPGQTPPSEKLNIAGIGVGGMGSGDIRSVGGSHNIVALCDPDQRALENNAKAFPKAALFADYRKMLETRNDIDAVTVATPDHVHAAATLMAMKMHKHVHCQKPLTHSVYEARKVGHEAAVTKVATQMGNFGQASEEARLICETIWSGALGTVREVHAGSNRIPMISQRGCARPSDRPPVPAWLNWDLWVGPSPMRPYHPCYHPFSCAAGGTSVPVAWAISAATNSRRPSRPSSSGIPTRSRRARRIIPMGRKWPTRPRRWPRSRVGTSRPKATARR